MLKPNYLSLARKTVAWIGLGAFYITLLIGRPGIEVFFFSSAAIAFLEFLFAFRKGAAITPYHLMILAPLTLIHYSTIGDFRIRLICYFILAYIFAIAASGRSRKTAISIPSAKPTVIWLTAFLIFAVASFVLYFQNVQLSGDEPHYLMISQSIAEDGDFNLANNMRDKTYTKYLPVDIQFHGKILDGKYLSYHMPGMSFLLLPFFVLFNLLSGFIPAPLYFRLAAALINACFALALFYLLRFQFPEKKITGIWLFFLTFYPLVFHSIHLYPELPAAALIMAAFLMAIKEKPNYGLSGLFLSSAAWFHVKYYPALIVLGLFILYKIVKSRQIKPGLFFITFPLINFILLMIFSKTLYHTFNPMNIFPGQDLLAPPIILRIKVFLAYFLDQRDGLLFYSPVFFFMFLGFKNRLKYQNLMLWIAIPYVAFHAFTTVRGAYAPAGRPLMFVIWIFMIWVAGSYLERKSDLREYGFRLLAGMNAFVLFWLFYYPLFVYQPVFSHTTQRASTLLLFLGSSIVNLWKLFPSFLTNPASSHPASMVWIGLLLAFLVFTYWKPFNIFPRPKQKLIISIPLFLLFIYLFCFYPHVHLIPENRYQGDIVSFYNNSGNFRHIEERRGFNILGGNTYKIFLEQPDTPQPLTLLFFNTDRVEVRVSNKTSNLFHSGRQKTDRFTIDWKELRSIRIKNRIVFPIEIRTKSRGRQNFLFLRFI